MYTADLISVNESRGLSPLMYVYDTQVYGSRVPLQLITCRQRFPSMSAGVAPIAG